MSTNSRSLVCRTPGELTDYLTKAKNAVSMALPKHLNPDRMLRLAVTCFSTTPALRECTAQSILASIVVASQIGLEPGVVGQGYLIPFKGTCTFVPGWQGLVGLLNNSGRATAWTNSVFEGDVWEFELGSKPKCRHVPGPNYGDPDKLIWVYACGKVNGSEETVIEAWPISRVWKHRDKFNKVGAKHYSYQHPEMYARKVVLLQVLKYMPRSIELNNALVAANAAEDGLSSRVQDGIVIEAEPGDIEAERMTNKPTVRVDEAEPAPKAERGAKSREAAPADGPSNRDKLAILIQEAGYTELQGMKVLRDLRFATGQANAYADLADDVIEAALSNIEKIVAKLSEVFA